jgi:hypothetical protein
VLFWNPRDTEYMIIEDAMLDVIVGNMALEENRKAE